VSRRAIAVLGAAVVTIGFLPWLGQAEETSHQTEFLTQVGPLDPTTGYPTYYQDSNGLRLSHCYDGSALCGGAESPLPDPTKPVSFPDNFPEESFYFLSQATIDLPGGTRATYDGTVEADFGGEVAPGQRAAFNRLRLRIDTPDAGHYTITTPYGVDEFDVAAGGDRSINFTEDIGIAANTFDGVLGGRVGTFLEWDTGPIKGPDGDMYVGDPSTSHAVTGSPFGTNFFRIDGPDIGGPGIDTISTNLFTLTGRIDTNSGVNPGHPTYSRSTTDGGFVDVQAASDPGKSIKAQLTDGGITTLRGAADGSYVARLPFTGATPPSTVMVENLDDKPKAVTHPDVTDLVTVTDATYDSDQQTLTVTAASSDQAVPPTLTATGFGALAKGTETLSPAIPDSGSDVAQPALTGTVAVGTKTFTGVAAPPESITVTSAAGGSSSSRVRDIGTAFAADPITADAGPDQAVQQGQQVTLDGGNSINGESYAWTQTSGPAVTLTGADQAVATFTAPNEEAALGFELTVSGPSGSSTDDVLITVQAVTAPVADAGPDQTGVLADNTVLLDASGSTGAASFAWTQVSGPAVTLTNADTSRASFTMPATTTPLVFKVTVTGPGGTASDQVSVSAQLDTLTVSRAEYRADQAQWRIDGNASILDNNTVSVYLGLDATGKLIGSSQVDPLDGSWEVRVRGSSVAPSGSTVFVQSSRGGQIVALFTQQ
jgi:K319-like protein